MREQFESEKELLHLWIRSKVAKVNTLDDVVIGQVRTNRKHYTCQQVFTLCLELLLEATKGIGVAEFLREHYPLNSEEQQSITRILESYQELKRNVYGIYDAHTTKRS